jgi:hypothetical protein
MNNFFCFIVANTFTPIKDQIEEFKEINDSGN